MNEMTPQECAEVLKEIDIYFKQTSHIVVSDFAKSLAQKKIMAINQSAAVMRKLAEGELVEVVHARWIFDSDGYVRCSACNQKAPVFLQYQDEPETNMSRYCPSCGALMDGKDD